MMRGFIGLGEELEFQLQWEAIGGFGTEDRQPSIHRIKRSLNTV